MAIDEQVAAVPTPAASRRGSPTSRLHTTLFALTAFVGAGLLFVVQPLVARLLLPSYGGSATVWSTSALFFQVLLLLAYGYSHWSTRRLGRPWQPRLHLVVLLLPVVALPLAIPSDAEPAVDASPVLWLLRTLVLVIGLPFAVVATTGPLLQRWYSWSDHARSDDPYFLFAASNLGSFGGLLAYPLLIEPRLTLAEQRGWWSVGFVVFDVLTAGCALSVRGRRPAVEAVEHGALPAGAPAARLTQRQMVRWAALAFLPSSLMLGVTSHISTDIAAIPLLWVVPLAIYLATFVVAFARTSRVGPVRLTRVTVAVAFVMAVFSLVPHLASVGAAVALNLLMLGLVAYAAHARLAAERPPAEHLTAFYLVIAGGGALGGLLNGFIAPVVFDRVLEYALVLVAVPLLLAGTPAPTSWLTRQWHSGRVRAATVLVFAALAPLCLQVALEAGAGHGLAVLGLLLLGLVTSWWLARIPSALVAGLVLLFVVATVSESSGVIARSRTFFGSYVVESHDDVHTLVHGTTTHGTQLRSPGSRSIPTTYYSRQGPLGEAFELGTRQSVGVVGLGTGTVAAYGSPGQTMTFFEIDPEMVRMASDPDLFSYVEDSAAEVDMVVGDGRLRLAATDPGSFDLIVLDAFSSDSIPVHLLTEEAMQTYADRLAPGGLLLVHVSNRVFDLEPVLAGAADSLGWSAALGRGAGADHAAVSVWVALDADGSATDHLRRDAGWRELGPRQVRWTDDYSSILSVLE